MGSTLDKKKMVQDQGKNKYGFILVAIFLIWLFWPQNNSFIRLSYWSYNLFYNATKLINVKMSTESVYHRNNAVYLAKIYPKNSAPALKEMQKAFSTMSKNAAETELTKLYREQALIKLYYGDKQGALEDFEESAAMEPIDNLRIAVLLADADRYKEAVPYCKDLIANGKEISVYGYVCMGYVYEKSGNEAAALRIYNWAIQKKPKEANLYIERANFKNRNDDKQGYEDDITMAKRLSPDIIPENASIIDNTVNLKSIPLSVK